MNPRVINEEAALIGGRKYCPNMNVLLFER